MKIIFEIDGREAIPVRAIPLATNWESLSPDELAGALATSDEHSVSFRGLVAYRFEDGEVRPIRAIWWGNFPCRALNALHEKLNALEAAGTLTKEEGYQHWREGSLPLLPPGAFVWRDEFEPRYVARYGSSGTSWLAEPYDGDDVEDGAARAWIEDAQLDARAALDFDPFVHSPELRALVMEGLPVFPAAAESRATDELSQPSLTGHPMQRQDAAALSVLATADSKGPASSRKVWTDERKAEVRTYRDKHGLRKTAEYYGVSEATISKHVPADRKGASRGPWIGLSKS